MKSPAARMERSTCVSAARCTTMLDRSTSGPATPASQMSPCTNSWRAWFITSCRFSRRPAYVSLSSVVTRQSGWLARANLTKLLPMNPAPPVTRTSTILARPVVRQRVVRLEPELVRLGVVVRLGGHVDHERHLGADALPAVVDQVGHLDQHRVLGADEELVDGAVGR